MNIPSHNSVACDTHRLKDHKNAWWRDAVIYQIYPRAFSDSNGDGIGDIAGVTRRMDYIQSLGVNAIWLSPFYPSPLKDGGYDVADYRNIDPRLGTLDDFDVMVSQAHARGIRVVVDIVPNHTSDQHPWFQEALRSQPGSPERERYIFRRGRGEKHNLPPTNWMSNFGGSAWQACGDGWYYLHLFAPEQPDLNWDNPEVRADFITTLKFWADRGVDGFRVDVSHALAKDLREPLRDRQHPEIPAPEDTRGGDPLWDRNEVHEIYREWREVLNSYDSEIFAIGETWTPMTSRVFEYAQQDELGAVFDFSLLKSAYDAREYREIIERTFQGATSVGASPTWVLGNHDVPRVASRLGLDKGVDVEHWVTSNNTDPKIDVALATQRARSAALIELGLPGTAFVYQGEELGLPEDLGLTDKDIQDPIWERSGHSFKGRDGCRVPLPWTRARGVEGAFGFSDTGKSNLPQPQWFVDFAADTQGQCGDGSMLSLYREAINLRSKYVNHRALAGTIAWHDERLHEDVLDWSLATGLRVLANCSRTQTVSVPDGYQVILSSQPEAAEGLVPPTTTVWCIRRTV
ncbi:glycoside hydrolase family 13 protein [Alloscardovia criceti]|uniref:glycoside hydrolase family 13 protein n=1 Tax=Alloscardovia criceti TaxID=356828 RepID=UPI00037A6434|nr:glycoside hydrolase family 13 protein [Alloscardovia criceti]